MFLYIDVYYGLFGALRILRFHYKDEFDRLVGYNYLVTS